MWREVWWISLFTKLPFTFSWIGTFWWIGTVEDLSTSLRLYMEITCICCIWQASVTFIWCKGSNIFTILYMCECVCMQKHSSMRFNENVRWRCKGKNFRALSWKCTHSEEKSCKIVNIILFLELLSGSVLLCSEHHFFAYTQIWHSRKCTPWTTFLSEVN